MAILSRTLGKAAHPLKCCLWLAYPLLLLASAGCRRRDPIALEHMGEREEGSHCPGTCGRKGGMQGSVKEEGRGRRPNNKGLSKDL